MLTYPMGRRIHTLRTVLEIVGERDIFLIKFGARIDQDLEVSSAANIGYYKHTFLFT